MISHFDNDIGLCNSGTYALGSGKNTWQDPLCQYDLRHLPLII